jgi:CO/xanthine dehydrogenase FAD-binding subunit
VSSSSSPRSLAAAFEALAAGALKVAGATDLLVLDHATGRVHASVLNVLGISELQGIREADGVLDIGAAVTFTQIRRSPEVSRHARVLVDAAATIGATQIQNRATIGGNIANASPAGDSLPALLALNAALVLAGPGGRRTVDYASFHTGYRKTRLAPDELIERVLIPLPAPPVQEFRKVGTRAAQAISKVVVAFTATPEGARLRDVRLAMGSVAATPTRLSEVEALLESEALSPEVADRAAVLVEANLHPIDDIRSTADYRRHVAGRVVRRLILDLLREKA